MGAEGIQGEVDRQQKNSYPQESDRTPRHRGGKLDTSSGSSRGIRALSFSPWESHHSSSRGKH